MMYEKHLKIMLSALLLICLSLALLFALTAQKSDAQEDLNVLHVTAGNIQGMVLINGKGAAGMLNTREGIEVEGQDSKSFSQTKLINLFYGVSHMSALRVIDAQSTEDFGFDAPLAKLTLFTDSGEINIALGRKCPVEEAYYLKTDLSDDLYLVDSSIAQLLTQAPDDLRELAFLPTLSGNNLSKLRQIRISHRDESMLLCQVEGDTVSTFFAMAEPVVTALNWETVYREIVTSLFSLSPDHFVSDSAERSEYGLDDPEYRLEIVYDGYVYEILFAPKDRNTFYCVNTVQGIVCEISADKIDFLSKSYIDIIGNSVYSKGAADVSSISAGFSDKHIYAEITGESNTLMSVCGEQQLDASDTVELVKGLGIIPATGIYDGEQEINSRILLSISYTLRNGETDILEFYPVDDRQCAVFVNGKCNFLTYISSVNDIIKLLEKYT